MQMAGSEVAWVVILSMAVMLGELFHSVIKFTLVSVRVGPEPEVCRNGSRHVPSRPELRSSRGLHASSSGGLWRPGEAKMKFILTDRGESIFLEKTLTNLSTQDDFTLSCGSETVYVSVSAFL